MEHATFSTYSSSTPLVSLLSLVYSCPSLSSTTPSISILHSVLPYSLNIHQEKCTAIGTIITINKMITTKIRHILIFISFHHISFLTRLAPLLNPCALIAKLSVLFSIESNLSPRSATLLMLSLIIPTVSSIC